MTKIDESINSLPNDSVVHIMSLYVRDYRKLCTLKKYFFKLISQSVNGHICSSEFQSYNFHNQFLDNKYTKYNTGKSIIETLTLHSPTPRAYHRPSLE